MNPSRRFALLALAVAAPTLAIAKRCLHECLHNASAPDRACYPELRQGIVTPACMEHCRSACGVQ